MPEILATAIFCDDVREEMGNKHSLMGIYGDNISVPAFPGAMTKFAIYVRIHLPIDFEPYEMKLFLSYPNGDRTLMNTIEKSMVRKSLKDAKASGNIIAGIYSIQIAAPFPVSEQGRIYVELEVESDILKLGSINFIQSIQDPETTSASASPPPS